MPFAVVFGLYVRTYDIRTETDADIARDIATHRDFEREPSASRRPKGCKVACIECEPPLTRNYYVVTPAIADLLAATPSPAAFVLRVFSKV